MGALAPKVAPQELGLLSAFLKHALPWSDLWLLQRHRTRGAPLPSPDPPRMPKSNSKETYLVPPKGHILVQNMWSDSQVVQRCRSRGAPFPIHQAPQNAQKYLLKNVLGTRPKAHLRQGTFEKPRFWPQIEDFLQNLWIKGSNSGALKIQNVYTPSDFRRFDPESRSPILGVLFWNPEAGFSKGVSSASSVTPKKTKTT